MVDVGGMRGTTCADVVLSCRTICINNVHGEADGGNLRQHRNPLMFSHAPEPGSASRRQRRRVKRQVVKGNRCRRQGRSMGALYGGAAGDVRRKDRRRGTKGGRREVQRSWRC